MAQPQASLPFDVSVHDLADLSLYACNKLGAGRAAAQAAVSKEGQLCVACLDGCVVASSWSVEQRVK